MTGTGSPVVLVHGIPGSGATWGEVAADLAQDHAVTVVDLLGFGESPRPQDVLVDAQAAALAATLDAIGTSAVIVGHDFGGPVALTLAGARPDLVRGLVLASTNVFPDSPVPFPLSLVRVPVLAGPARRVLFGGPALRMLLKQGAHDARLDADIYLGDADQQRAIATIFGEALARIEEIYTPIEKILRGLEVPAAVVWGDRDPFLGVAQAQRTAAAAPGAVEAQVLAGAGHFLPEERPREVAAAIRAHVSACATART